MAGGLLTCIFKENANTILNLFKGWQYVRKTEVVVGITEGSNATRESGVSNAELLYLHENGVPSHNIPPRPVLKPAIADAPTKMKIEKLMKEAMKEALVHGNVQKCEQNFHKAGMTGRDACKKWITDGSHLAPNAPATVARKGSSLPLVDTGSMLNSIDYEVRKK